MGRESHFGDQERGRCSGNTESKTDQSTSPDEHADVLCGGLKSHSDEHDRATDEDSHSSTEFVRDTSRNGQRGEATDGLDGVEQLLTCQLRKKGGSTSRTYTE